MQKALALRPDWNQKSFVVDWLLLPKCPLLWTVKVLFLFQNLHLNSVIRGLCWASRWAGERFFRRWAKSTVATWCSGTEIRLFHKWTATSLVKTATVSIVHVHLFTMNSAPHTLWQCKPQVEIHAWPGWTKLSEAVTDMGFYEVNITF